MGHYGEKAYQLFLDGYNCAQAVVGAFCEEYGADWNTAMTTAASLRRRRGWTAGGLWFFAGSGYGAGIEIRGS